MKGSKTDEKSTLGPGAEGPHISTLESSSVSGAMANTVIEDLPPKAPVPVSPTDNAIKGDWVLFHPVYTPEELRSVEVRSIFLHRGSSS